MLIAALLSELMQQQMLSAVHAVTGAARVSADPPSRAAGTASMAAHAAIQLRHSMSRSGLTVLMRRAKLISPPLLIILLDCRCRGLGGVVQPAARPLLQIALHGAAPAAAWIDARSNSIACRKWALICDLASSPTRSCGIRSEAAEHEFVAPGEKRIRRPVLAVRQSKQARAPVAPWPKATPTAPAPLPRATPGRRVRMQWRRNAAVQGCQRRRRVGGNNVRCALRQACIQSGANRVAAWLRRYPL